MRRRAVGGRVDDVRNKGDESRNVQILRAAWSRWLAAWREIAAATVASLLAWLVAQRGFDHPHPIFAAIIAIVVLAPGIPDHRKQARSLVLGVAIGIVVGEMVLFVPDSLAAMGMGVFASMMIAAAFGAGPVVPIQAGVSLLLVLVLGPAAAGYVRLIDVVIGAVIGLACGWVFLGSRDRRADGGP